MFGKFQKNKKLVAPLPV